MTDRTSWTLKWRFLALAVFATCAALATPEVAAAGKKSSSQLEFGIDMAKRGLWNEALFRFERVHSLEPNNARVLNNMAVAYEAVGKFERALETYKKALAIDSANRELRRNYAQFLEFYQGLRPADDKNGAAADEESASPVDSDEAGAGGDTANESLAGGGSR